MSVAPRARTKVLNTDGIDSPKSDFILILAKRITRGKTRLSKSLNSSENIDEGSVRECFS